ncbi:MAG: PadR family transcriptional regulator [Chitinophagales bacterium]|jgi:PadR family transcriptional regulator PadR|nr:PadR family transcriptional regulator [Chitinophagales bacterium]
MNIENAKTQMLKGIFEFCILSSLAQGDKYASEIIDDFSKTKLDLVEGTIYPILTRLKNSEYLSYYWQESNSGPPRKYFKITEKGVSFLFELNQLWHDISLSVNQLIKS